MAAARVVREAWDGLSSRKRFHILTEPQTGTGFWFAEVRLHGACIGHGFSSVRATAVAKAVQNARYGHRGFRARFAVPMSASNSWRPV